MSLEDQLSGWTAPSSSTEQDKQDRTERMIREAVEKHAAFGSCPLNVFAKGSYANNTNVKADSDVDVAVECTAVEYWEEASPGDHPGGTPYDGPWTPSKLRAELEQALQAKFPGQVDASGSTALTIHSSSARVDADVVPAFSYRYYMKSGSRSGIKIFAKTGRGIVNYPAQQLENGRLKNTSTGYRFKKAVRILKRVSNRMEEESVHRAVPSYFIECLTYNAPNSLFSGSTWTATTRDLLIFLWDGLKGEEPTDEAARWLEVNECLFLFHAQQKWTRADGRDFVLAAWNYLGFSS